MADFGAVQPRQFILDSSRQNGATLGEFHQNNNRYLCTLELFDHSVPVTIPADAKIAIKCKKSNSNVVYTLDENNPDFASKVSFTPGENKIVVDRWGALVAQDGQILLAVVIDGMSTYTVTYTVDKDMMSGTPIMHHETPVGDFAKSDLSNVDKSSILKLAKLAGLAKNDLEDVDLDKLAEKINASDVGKTISNLSKAIANAVDPVTFDRELKSNAAFNAIVARGDVPNMTPAKVKELFYSNRYEVQAPVDLTQEPYRSITKILMVYQITSNGQTIKQVLAPHTQNQIVMVEVLFSKGVTSGTVEIDVADGESLQGDRSFSNHVTFTEDGYAGYFLPLQNESGYEFVSHHETQPYSLAVSDESGAATFGVTTLEFASPMRISNPSAGTVRVEFDGQSGVGSKFVDGETGLEFTPTKIQSRDKSIRIANLNGMADLSVASYPMNEGIMATLGKDEIFNSTNENKDFFFDDVKHPGGTYVYANKQNNSYVLQEIDKKDPLVTGGTEFLLGLAYFPSELTSRTITQDGYFRIEFVTSDGMILRDVDGNPMATEIHYKAGQKERKQLYLGLVKMKNYTEVKVRFASNFVNEELVTVGASSAILIQPVSEEFSSGMAVLNFMAYTGYGIHLNRLHYGKGDVMLSKSLIGDLAETETPPSNNYLGDGLYFDSNSKLIRGVTSGSLNLKANGKDLPVWSIYKLYNTYDVTALRYQSASASVTVVADTPYGSMVVDLLKYTGTAAEIPQPAVLSYLNSQPQFAPGWVKVDSMPILQNSDGADKTTTKIFDFPLEEGIRAFAFVMAPADSQIPFESHIKEFVVDISPVFTRAVITDTSHIHEQMLLLSKGFYKSIVDCPSFLESYRYTANAVDTKVPAGVVKGNGMQIVNDNAWTDAGSSDPHKVQGDFKFLADGKVNFEYGAQVFNDTATVNDVEFWLAKVNGDGSFTEVPGSRYTATVEANRTAVPKSVHSNAFTFEAKENESYRMMMKSNVQDGFYLLCTPNGSPMFYASIVFDAMVAKDKDVRDTMVGIAIVENGKQVTNKTLQYDVTTGKLELVDKT